MNIDEIRLKWGVNNIDKKANINLWNEKANYFGNYTIPTFEEDNFLKILKDENLLNKEYKVLDVGCGGGKYSLALSKECKEVYGTDLSPKMIEFANKNKEKFNMKNVTFSCDNWHEIDLKKNNFYKNFDLVFACMTPAINSAFNFEKLMNASKKYCVLRCNLKRRDIIYDKIREELDIKKKENLDFLYAFNLIYLNGYIPRVFYEEKQWTYKEPLEKAYDIYINKIKSIKKINKNEEEKIKEILNNLSENKYVEEQINSTVATIVWKVEEVK